MTLSPGGDPAVSRDRILEVFGETVIIRRWQRFAGKSANSESEGRNAPMMSPSLVAALWRQKRP